MRLLRHAASPREAPREVRKTVTIVFSDLTGSTALGEQLDSESLRAVMARYFDVMRAALERHGGTVEKFIGDAVMAVFGLPQAARGRRAAGGARRRRHAAPRSTALNAELDARCGVPLANRTGVNTGEVVAGDASARPAPRRPATRSTSPRASSRRRRPRRCCIGELTHALVRDAVEVEAVEPLELKGKAEPVPRLPAARASGGRRVRAARGRAARRPRRRSSRARGRARRAVADRRRPRS